MPRPVTPTTLPHEQAKAHADLYDLATNSQPWLDEQDGQDLDQIEDLASQQLMKKRLGVVESR
jgi:hypothetical protein